MVYLVYCKSNKGDVRKATFNSFKKLFVIRISLINYLSLLQFIHIAL